MPIEDKDEILHRINTAIFAVRFFGWIGAVLGAGAFGCAVVIVGIAVSDHYDQIALRKDSDWMMPRVTQLWYFGNKEPSVKNIP